MAKSRHTSRHIFGRKSLAHVCDYSSLRIVVSVLCGSGDSVQAFGHPKQAICLPVKVRVTDACVCLQLSESCIECALWRGQERTGMFETTDNMFASDPDLEKEAMEEEERENARMNEMLERASSFV